MPHRKRRSDRIFLRPGNHETADQFADRLFDAIVQAGADDRSTAGEFPSIPSMDADLHNADWPKRTPDRLEDIEREKAARESVATRDPDFVYHENDWANTGNLVCLPVDVAKELAAVWNAIESTSTWGELLDALKVGSPHQHEIVREWFDGDVADNDEGEVTLDNPHDITKRSAYQDGDWPPWSEQVMLDVLPEEVLALGEVRTSVFSGDFISIPAYRAARVVTVLALLGFRCIENRGLVAAASGIHRYE